MGVKGHKYLPRLPLSITGAPTIGSIGVTLDANGEGWAVCCEAPKSGNIRKILMRTVAATVGSTATLTGRLKAFDRATNANGPSIPHATDLSHVNATGDHALSSSDDAVWITFTLTADAAVTKGDTLMVEVILTAVGTTVSLTSAGNNDDAGQDFPYSLTNTSGAWAAHTMLPCLGFEYDDGTYEPICGTGLGAGITTTTFGSGSTPDTFAQTYRFDHAETCGGFWLWVDADDDYTVRLCTTNYHQANATGILVSKSILKQDRRTVNGGVMEKLFSSDVQLSANTDYMLVIEPGATGVTLYDQAYPSLAAMDSDDGGQLAYLRTAKDPTQDSDWTKYNSGTFRSLMCGLLLKGSSAVVGSTIRAHRGGKFQRLA